MISPPAKLQQKKKKKINFLSPPFPTTTRATQRPPAGSQAHSDEPRSPRRLFMRSRFYVTSGGGAHWAGPCRERGGARTRRGRGAAAARSAQARLSRSRRAERLTIYGQSWGASRARGAALPGSARPQRLRAGQGASRPLRPGLGPPSPPLSAPCTPGAAFRPLSPGSASARSDSRRARPLQALWRARRGNKWARMPYEISKCRGPVRPPPQGWAPALPVCLAPSAIGRVRAVRRGPRGAGEGCGSRLVSAPPPSRGRRAGRRGKARRAPQSWRCGRGPAEASASPCRAWLRERADQEVAPVPCAPSKWRPPLRVGGNR